MAETKKAKTKWTPGPWKSTFDEDDGHAVLMGKAIGSPGNYPSHMKWVCEHSMNPEYDTGPVQVEQFAEAEANARLIAAAPTLAAALLEMIEAFVVDNNAMTEWQQEVARAADRALAKAERK